MTTNVEDQLRTLFAAQDAAAEVDETPVAEIVPISSARSRRWPLTVVAVTSAAAVIAGVLALRPGTTGDKDGTGVTNTVDWENPVRLPEHDFAQYELGIVPDGYERIHVDATKPAGKCTSWTDSGATPLCESYDIQSIETWYESGDARIVVETQVAGNGMFGGLGEIPGGHRVDVDGNEGVVIDLASGDGDDFGDPGIDTTAWDEELDGGEIAVALIWRQDGRYISVAYAGPADRQPSDNELVTFAESVREVPVQVMLALEFPVRLATDPEGQYMSFAVAGTNAAPCIGYSLDYCASVAIAPGELFAVQTDDTFGSGTDSLGGSVLGVGAVDPSITQVRIEGVGATAVVDTHALPGYDDRFFGAPNVDGLVAERLVFLDASGTEVAQFTLDIGEAFATGQGPWGGWRLVVGDGFFGEAVLLQNSFFTSEWVWSKDPVTDAEPLFLERQIDGPLLGIAAPTITRVEFNGTVVDLMDIPAEVGGARAFVAGGTPDADGDFQGRLTAYDASGAVVRDLLVTASVSAETQPYPQS